jgi:hypothetical protein
MRHVESGHRDEAHAEVLEGLEEEQRVVVHPSEEIEEGTRVEGRGS